MKFLDPYSGTNWETPARRRVLSVRVWLLAVVALLVALHAQAATVYLYNSGDDHFAEVRFRTWEGGTWSGSSFVPAWQSLGVTSSGGITEIFRAEIPDGVYQIEADYYRGDGSTISQTWTDQVVSGRFVIGVQYPTTFYAGRNANEHGSVVVPPDSAAAGGDATPLADYAEVFSKGFFTGLAWELFGFILALVRRLRTGTGME